VSEQSGHERPAAPTASTPPQPYELPPPRAEAVSEAVLITGSMLADTRIDFERGMRYAEPLTLGLIALLASVFAWQLGTNALADQASITAAGALVRERVLAGEVWRILSAAFLHGGPDHIVGNCISLYVLGLACEHAFGARGMALLFLGSAIGGSLVSLATSPGPSVGASGAIFGLMGALVLVLHRQRHRILIRDKRIGVVIVAWAGYTFLLGAADPVVDNGAHLGGLLAGAVLGAVVPVRLLDK
jgi:rhomboid protease GluP